MDVDRFRPALRLGRDVTLFVGGIAGIVHETVVAHSERPTLLILFSAMIGLPFAIKADQGSKPEPKKTDDASEVQG